MSNPLLLLAVALLGGCVAALLVARGPRELLLLLGGQYVAAAGVSNALLAPDFRIGTWPVSTAALVDVALGATVLAVLGLTLWRLRPEVLRALTGADEGDEFAQAAARRAARAEVAAGIVSRTINWGEVLLPLFATVLAGIAAGALTRLYPLGASAAANGWPAGDLCFYWIALAGLLLLTLARDVVRLSMALLLLLHSGGLLAGLLAGRFDALTGGLLALGTVIVALALAYVWSATALYGGLWDEG